MAGAGSRGVVGRGAAAAPRRSRPGLPGASVVRLHAPAVVPAVASGAVAGGLAAVGVLLVEAAERRFMGGPPHSDVPGEAVRAPTSLHLAHGAVWGALHGATRAAGRDVLPAVAVHGAAMLVTDSVLLRAVGLTGAPWTWGRADLTTSLARTGVHAVLTAVVWSVLRGPARTTA